MNETPGSRKYFPHNTQNTTLKIRIHAEPQDRRLTTTAPKTKKVPR